MTNKPVRAIVLGHAAFASGMVSAVEQITGNGDVLVPLSNSSLGSGGIEEMVADILNSTGARVVFSDLPAGSATMAVRRLQRTMPDVTLIAGANLALLLEFVQQPMMLDENSAAAAVAKARSAIIAHGAKVVD